MPNLPTGTVTFLFTDIEGSTALWERDQVAMATAVARHLAILRAATAAHNGALFKVVGDAVQVAFPTAPDAISAALDAQHSLVVEFPPEVDGTLRVRMALHTTAAEPRDGDYLTPGLNRLSRLLAAGHGGQVLVSLAAQELARDGLPSGASLRDLGEHPLRDLYRPERVFQLLHPDLPAQFPPLRTLATRPNNLPLQPTPFLGREDQVARIVDLLCRDDVRLLTITGPGGVGKTRLALQAAADRLEDFPDGAWFIDLSTLSDPALVPSVVAGVLGVRGEASDLVDRLSTVLSEQHLLVVLDNFERVIDATQVVSDLLAKVPGLKVLATSRTPLHAYGEREYPLGPLPLPDPAHLPSIAELSQYEAVRLFIERAQAVKPDFAVTSANAPAVAEICSRLDGLPLAIELAAAFVKILPPQALLKRLEKRLPLLTGGARTLPARQQTMRDAVAWSHDLLTADEQILFRRLAVFSGGCTLEAAEAIAASEGALDVFGGMASLIDKSLLRQEEGVEGEPRFRMLETVREYGLERLEASGEGEAVRHRHAAYFADWLETATLGLEWREEIRWVERLKAEYDNVQAALDWSTGIGNAEMSLRLSGSMWPFFYLHGHFLREGRVWLERGLAIDVAVPAAVRARALAAAAWIAHYQGDDATASIRLEESLVHFRELDEPSGLGTALHTFGIIAEDRGDYATAKGHFLEARARFEEAGEVSNALLAVYHLGVIAYGEGDHSHAMKHLEDVERQARQMGDRFLLTASLDYLGQLASLRGDLAAGGASIAEALALDRAAADQEAIMRGLAGAAVLAMADGRAESTARLLAAAENQREHIGFGPFALPERTAYEQAREAARGQLGDHTYDDAWAAGRRLSLEEAMAEALALANEVAAKPRGQLPQVQA